MKPGNAPFLYPKPIYYSTMLPPSHKSFDQWKRRGPNRAAYGREIFMRIRTIVLMLVVVCAFYVACSSQSQWTREEKLNLKHFFAAQKADAAAVHLSNAGMPNSAMPPNTANEILRLMKEALGESQTIRDDVLAKAHPDLPEHFRRELQRSLELRIRNLEVGDASAEIEGSRLHYQWIYWINSHKNEIKVTE